MSVLRCRVTLAILLLPCMLIWGVLCPSQHTLASPHIALHAQYDHSDPAANAHVPSGDPPARVQVWFTEQVDPDFSSLRVYNKDRQPVDLHDSHLAPDNPSSLIISLQPHLPDGAYTVVFHTVSAEDGHSVTSGFSFVVGGAPLPTNTGALFIQSQSTDANFNVWSISIRWINYLGMAGLVGGLIFLLLVWQPAVARLRSTMQERLAKVALQIEARADAFLLGSLVVLVAGWMAFLIYQACIASASAPWELLRGPTLLTLLWHSRFGTIWLIRLALIVGAGLLWYARCGQVQRLHGVRTPVLWLALIVGLGIMYTDALNSHASANRLAALLVPVDLLHLASASFWIGGLCCLVLMLPVALRALVPGSGDRTRVLAVLIPLFTRVALLSVLVLALSGTIQALVELGVQDEFFQGQYDQVLSAFFASAYGRALAVKTGIFALLLLLGALNAFGISPRMRLLAARTDAASGAGSFAAGRLQRRFQATVRMEVLLALAVLLVVGGLTSLSPPQPPQAATSATGRPLVRQGQVADLSYQFVINPGKIGPNEFDVALMDSKGQPVQHADAVEMYFVMLDMDMGTEVLDLMPVSQQPGHYQAQASLLSMSGNWQVEMVVRRTGFDDAKVTMYLNVQQ